METSTTSDDIRYIFSIGGLDLRKSVPVPLLLAMAFHATYAHAETDQGGGSAITASRGSTRTGAMLPPEEIVVTATRRGEAKVGVESEFSEEEISAQGADSIQVLLTRLAPFISGDGEEPVILINGKPAGLDRSFLSYPPEALEQFSVLKPEAAAQYGEPVSKRVVNLVIKKHFSMLNADASIDFATAGGQYGGDLSVARIAINNNTRWNIKVQVGADSAFPKSSRNIPPREGVFDRTGFVAALDGGAIDPELSLIAGQIVTSAGVPLEASTAPPSLSDFASRANLLSPVNPNQFETLQSSRRAALVTLGITRPIGSFTASWNFNANRNTSEGQRGLPMASVILPADNPWSPFEGDVLLTRPFASERALRISGGSTSLGASMTLNGNIGDWQTSLGLNYGLGWSDNMLETGIDIDRIQKLLDGADQGFNPYGPWDDALLLTTRARMRNDTMGARTNLRKSIFELPSGPVIWTVSANIGRNSSLSKPSRDPVVTSRIVRTQSYGQTSLSVPISRSMEGVASLLGALTVDLNASAQKMTNSRTLKSFGSSLNWSPLPVLQLRGSIDRSESSPSFDQLDAPIVVTVNRIFDYVEEEVAEPLWITGGNPDLRRGTRRNVSLAAMVRPLGNEILTVNTSYRRSQEMGGVAAFPELTPLIEAAFPDRVTRDADGRLVSVDARAINIAHRTDSDLTTSIALRLPSWGNSLKRGVAALGGDPLQFSVSIDHRWRLTSKLLPHPDVPAIDQLRDSGQSRHGLSGRANVAKRGIGANLSFNWSTPSRLRGTGVNGGFRIQPPLTFNFSAFMEPDRLFSFPNGKGALNGLKTSIDIQNITNAYRRVMLDDGTVPTGYSRAEIDPLGRTVRLSLRKNF